MKRSRWAGPKTRATAGLIGFKLPPRYTEREEQVIREKYTEQNGWHKGAKVS